MTTTDAQAWLVTEEPGWNRLQQIKSTGLENFVNTTAHGNRIQIEYFRREADGVLMAKVLFGSGAQGPPGHAHGGSIASVLDESMGCAAWMSGHVVVAAELTARFKKMVPLGAPLVVETRVVGVTGRKVTMGSELRSLAGEVHAEGEALFVTLNPERFGDMAIKAREYLRTSGGSHGI